MVSEAQKAAKRRYDLKTQQYVFRLRLDGDADIIARLNSIQNKTEYLRRLVREDMRRGA